MPLERIIEHDQHNKVAVWHLTESLEQLHSLIHLSAEDRKTFEKFRIEKRKKEWLCSRILLQEILEHYPAIDYTSNGKPFLSNSDKHISISHTFGYVAVTVSDDTTALDIELCTDRIDKLADKFVHEKEELFFTEKDRRTFLTLIWSAKESLYKYFDEYGVIFKNDFRILPFELKTKSSFDTHTWFKQIDKQLKLNYEVNNNYILVYHLSTC
ncbi:4'-phosphopantetheinyl transferase superfamily protein [Carboxylicivirga sp. N1Y90]|uniref:4'-phosphopantetheinyl transferase superfamily protein n=1 Tax=Carboxylicivirga fragile TaxID=3417571 RepID=UPI003D342361|nr:4'-phosphopantetheinyl transferase superfamily protein [Marinilabiliaceae bacterium N1Y90]